MLKRSLGLYPPRPLWKSLPIVQLASVPIRERWRLGRDTTMYPPVQIIPGVVHQSEMDWDLGGWSRGMTWPTCKQLLAILQVCWHCLALIENCFEHSDRFARHVYEALFPHSVGL